MYSFVDYSLTNDFLFSLYFSIINLQVIHMMRKITSLVLVLFALSSLVYAQSPEEIIWMTEEFPPYGYTEDGVIKGVYVDVLLEVWKKLGIKKTRQDIKMLPWARAYTDLQTKPITALFSMSKTEKREKLGFKWVGPINTGSFIGIIAKKDKAYKFNSLSDVNSVLGKDKLGVVRNDSGKHFFLEQGGDSEKLIDVNVGEQLIKMLKNDRIPAIAYSTVISFYMMKKSGIDISQYEVVYALSDPKTGGFFGFHKDTPDETIVLIQKTFDELVSEGVVARVISSYTGSD